jgi:DNA-binding PadR family transcriptional regulator
MAVREGLLALLQDGPRHGYQLKSDFEATTGGVWPLNVGQVYTTLDRLQRDGLVSVDESDGGKRYALTRSGKAELGGWWETVPVDDAPPRDELLLKVLFAIEQGRDHALAVITRQRTALTRLLQEHRRKRSRKGEAGSELAARLVTDAMAVRAEADLRWLDLCEARLMQEER